MVPLGIEFCGFGRENCMIKRDAKIG